MADTIVDTTILIDATNAHPKAVAYIRSLVLRAEALVHAQAAAELLSGTRDAKEQRRLVRFLRQFTFIHPNEADSAAALQFLLKFHLSHDLGFGDCLIGSTALRLDLPVATLNVRDFRLFPGLKVIRPY
ncbi:MAG: PIN domain-containing protein [Phycisphaerae bacterium]